MRLDPAAAGPAPSINQAPRLPRVAIGIRRRFQAGTGFESRLQISDCRTKLIPLIAPWMNRASMPQPILITPARRFPEIQHTWIGV